MHFAPTLKLKHETLRATHCVWSVRANQNVLETSSTGEATTFSSFKLALATALICMPFIKQAGAVYVFTRLPVPIRVDPKCVLGKESDSEGIWQGYERFKLQAHDAVAADRFGSAVSYLVSSCPIRYSASAGQSTQSVPFEALDARVAHLNVKILMNELLPHCAVRGDNSVILIFLTSGNHSRIAFGRYCHV